MSTHSSSLATLSAEIAALVQATAPRVVSVAARPHRPVTGVVIANQLVVTVHHGVEREQDIGVLADGTRYEAALVGRDPATDIAVLRVPGLEIAPVAIQAAPATGSLVISISRTASGTVSAGLGVITSVGGALRTARGVVLPSIIRTDAALRPGTAGGALVDASGNLVGITTPGLLRGLPVAVPSTEATRIAERLAASQPLGRGYLGVSVQGVHLSARQRDAAPEGRGLLVFGVGERGAAERAGLLVGDVLVRFNNQPLARPEDLQDALIGIAPGTDVAVAVLRGASREEIRVTIDERPPAA